MSLSDSLKEIRLTALQRREEARSREGSVSGIFDGYGADGTPYARVDGQRVPLAPVSSGSPQNGERIALQRNGQQFTAVWRGR